jgi:hypothetical protein
MNPRGTYDRLQRGERPVGVRIAKDHRVRVLEQSGESLRTWQRAVKAWTDSGLAHVCDRRRTFLVLDASPICYECRELIATPVTPERDTGDAVSDTRDAFYVQTGEPSTGTGRGNTPVIPPEITPEKARELLKGASRTSRRRGETNAREVAS